MQCQLNKGKSGIFLRSYRMCWNRGKIGKISTDIRNSELGSIWKYSFTLKPINLLPEKTCWNLDQSAAEKRPCATQWLVWLNKEPEAISFSSWLQQGWLWHRMWREQVKSLQKNSWSSEEQQKKTKPKNKPNQLKNSRILEKKCLITMSASFEMLFEGFGLSDSSKISSSWRQITACDEYQALFHVACPPCREAVWHFNERLYRNLKGFILNYTDLLGRSGEVTSLQALVYSLQKEGNVVQSSL